MQTSSKVGGGLLVALIASIGLWEGRRLQPYQDIGGVWTVCDGITGRAVQVGRTYTPEECDALLHANIESHAAAVSRCIDLDILPDRVSFAVQHFAFNVGAGAFCRSTARRLFAAGQFDAGCHQFTRWVFVQGVDCRDPANRCRGIVRRREYERDVCLGVIDYRSHAWPPQQQS